MKHYGLIGYPLGHSFSSQYFNKKFLDEGIAADYKTFEISDLSGLRQLINDHKLSGLNVTIPYKTAVIDQLDTIEPDAAAIGAVNCIRINDQVLTGFNTDILGFEQGFLKDLPAHRTFRALIFGTGGASKAVIYVLQKAKIPYQLVSRQSGEGLLSYQQLRADDVRNATFLINTTPVGMFPDTTLLPIPYSAVDARHFAFDLIYNPTETPFLQNCKRRGAKVTNGLNMLYLQAEAAWKIFGQ